MEGSHMTSYDAEQREAKEKGGKDGYIREVEKLGQRCGRGGSTNGTSRHRPG